MKTIQFCPQPPKLQKVLFKGNFYYIPVGYKSVENYISVCKIYLFEATKSGDVETVKKYSKILEDFK